MLPLLMLLLSAPPPYMYAFLKERSFVKRPSVPQDLTKSWTLVKFLTFDEQDWIFPRPLRDLRPTMALVLSWPFALPNTTLSRAAPILLEHFDFGSC